MKAESISNLKKELTVLSKQDLLDICLKVLKFKKENKELVTYLLFESNDIPAFIEKAKAEIENAITTSNFGYAHYAKKSLRKTLVITNKYIKYSNSPIVQAELLIFFCQLMKENVSALRRNPTLFNMYNNQLKKIDKAIASMHEDLQYDYNGTIDNIRL